MPKRGHVAIRNPNWACSYCGAAFKTRNAAAMHELSAHGIAPRKRKRRYVYPKDWDVR